MLVLIPEIIHTNNMTTTIEIKINGEKNRDLWSRKGYLKEIISDIQYWGGPEGKWPVGKRIGVTNFEGDLIGSYKIMEVE